MIKKVVDQRCFQHASMPIHPVCVVVYTIIAVGKTLSETAAINNKYVKVDSLVIDGGVLRPSCVCTIS